jgi:O-antigen ligase/tetratricopeptide (TPR) repeat protein
VDLGLCGVIFVAPYFFGGRHDFGRLVFVALVAATAVAWFTRQAMLPAARWPRTAAHGLLLLAVALVVLQIIPLPADWLTQISPRTAELLPLWSAEGNAAAHMGAWQTLSLTPHETTKSLAMLVSYCLLFLVVVGRAADHSDIRRLLTWIGLSAAAMAIFGLLQYATSDGRYFWFYERAHRSATQSLAGPFINRNHFADFLVLGMGPLLSLLPLALKKPDASAARHRSTPSAKQRFVTWSVAAATAIVLVTILLTRSRGGAVALFVAVGMLLAIYLSRGLADRRFLFGLVALPVVVGALLSIHGGDQVVERLDDFADGSLDNIDHGGIRRKIWAANVAAIEAGCLAGSGVGSHSEICPVYLPQYFTKEYTHAENGYLQIVSESGVGGALLLLGAISLVATWCFTAWRRTTDANAIRLLGATAAGLAASAVHSAVDFVWYIPACMSLVVVLSGCALRLAQLSGATEKRAANARVMSRGRWWELAAAALLVGAWAVHTYVGPGVASIYWERYLRASVAHSDLRRARSADLVSATTESELADEAALNESMLRALQQVVRWDPRFARAHLKLAVRCFARFDIEQRLAENAMSLNQICDAIGKSHFASPVDLHAWLQRAVGQNLAWLHRAAAESRLAAELCPLLGEAYVHLAQLSILDGATPQIAAAYIDQALRVRPHNADVLFEIGRQELAATKLDAALARWQPCLADPGPHQLKIITMLAGYIPASTFVSTFEPDWPIMRTVWSCYRDRGAIGELPTLLAYAAQKTKDHGVESKGGLPPAVVWYWQSQLHADVGRTDEVLACLEQAYKFDPRQYPIRYSLGKTLLAAGRTAQAEPHFRWCLARQPSDKSLSAALIAISKTRLGEREVAHATRSGTVPMAGAYALPAANSSIAPR